MKDEPDWTLSQASPRRRFLFRLATYLVAYLAGIVSCIAFTPVELVLADKLLAGVYLWFSLPGFLFFFLGYETEAALFLYVGWAGLSAMALGIASVFLKWSQFATLRPWLLAFPIGFVGAMGAFYTIAASI